MHFNTSQHHYSQHIVTKQHHNITALHNTQHNTQWLTDWNYRQTLHTKSSKLWNNKWVKKECCNITEHCIQKHHITATIHNITYIKHQSHIIRIHHTPHLSHIIHITHITHTTFILYNTHYHTLTHKSWNRTNTTSHTSHTTFNSHHTHTHTHTQNHLPVIAQTQQRKVKNNVECGSHFLTCLCKVIHPFQIVA